MTLLTLYIYNVIDPESPAEDYDDAFNEARKTHADLELEGREKMAELGRQFMDTAVSVRERCSSYAILLIASHKVEALLSAPETIALGLDMKRAVHDIQQASRRLPEDWRGAATRCWQARDPIGSWRDETSQSADGAPPYELVGTVFVALDHANRTCFEESTRRQLLTRSEVEKLLWASTQWPEDSSYPCPQNDLSCNECCPQICQRRA